MKMSDSIGLEIERREKAMTFEEWIRQECFKAPPEHSVELAKSAWNHQQARIEALEDALHAILGEEVGFDETESLAKIFIVARQALEGER